MEKTRLNVYLTPSVKERIEKYAKENMMPTSACINFILKQYLDGIDLVSKMPQMNDAIASLVTVAKAVEVEN